MGVKLGLPQWVRNIDWGVFGNRMLRKIFGPMRDKVMGEWGRWHNETLYDLYSPNIWVIKSRRMGLTGHVACMWKRRGAYSILMGRLEGSRPLRRPRHRWWDDIKTDLQEVGWRALIRLILLMMGTGWRFLWMQKWTCGLASQEGHFSMKLVSFVPVHEILLRSVCVCCRQVVHLPGSQD